MKWSCAHIISIGIAPFEKKNTIMIGDMDTTENFQYL